MLAKILMCECYKETFDSEGNDCIKKAIHFQCKCKDKHHMSVLFCKDHPYGSNFNYQLVERKCLCANGVLYEVCQFCFNVRYLLNFKYFKIYLRFENELVTIRQYFKSIKECEPFFFYDEGSNYIEISLDNPDEPKISVNTDCVYTDP